MTTTRWRRLLLAGGVLLLAVAVTVHVLVVRDAKPQLWFMIDLDVYRWGGEQARAGRTLYDARYENFLPFTYPPIAAVVFMPLSTLDFSHLKMLLTAGNLAALVTSCAVAWRATGRRALVEVAGGACLVGAVAVWLEPVQQTLKFGQINVLLMVLVLVDLCLPDHVRVKGVGTGIATGIKLTPGIFVVHLLLTRRVRPALVALATFAVTVLAGIVVLPDDARRYWVDHLFADSSRVGSVGYVGNQSLHGTLARLAGSVGAVDPWWMVLALVAGVLGLWAAAHAHESGDVLGGVLLCALTGLLVSPISWTHHWVWVAPAIVWAIDRGARATGRVRTAWAAAVALAMALFAAWFFRLDPGDTKWLPHGLVWFSTHEPLPTGDENLVQRVLGDLYVLLGTAVLATVVWRVRAALAHDARRLRDATLSARRSRGTTRRADLPGDHRPARSTQPTRAASGPGSSGR